MRLFLDTNVLIDFYAQREPFCQAAKKLLIMKAFGDAELWASAKSFTDIFYVLRKNADSVSIQSAFEESFQWLQLCGVDGSDVALAAQMKWHDFGDCLVYICAQKVRADYLITRDEGGFEKAAIPVLTPEELLRQVEEAEGLSYDEIELI